MNNCQLSKVAVVFLVINSMTLAVVHSSSEETRTQLKGNINNMSSLQNIREFIRNSSNMANTLRMAKFPQVESIRSVRYKLGTRLTGDRLVFQNSDVLAYPAKKDVTIRISYPESGSGSIVTYVEVICEQDNDDGNAYVADGGIGQRYISIILGAKQTVNFSYIVKIYGIY